MKKITKRILACAMALTLLLGMTTMVSADLDNPTQASTGLKLGGGFLTKDLILPNGATVKARDFEFAFTKVSVDGRTTPTDLATMPTLTAKQSFVGNDTTTDIGGGLEKATGNTNTFTAVQSDGSTPVVWPHAGEYVYTVKEIPQPTSGAGHDPAYTYSLAEYQVTVFVTNVLDSDEQPTGALQIDSVGFCAISNDAGTAVPSLPKTDPVFTNKYEPLTTFEVSKTVVGEYADATLPFAYTLAMTRPTGTEATAEEYVGVIFNADGSVASTPNTVEVVFPATQTTATSVTFNLKHGQYVRFEEVETGDPGFDEGMTGLPTGVTYTLTEAAAPGYTAQVDVLVNAAALTDTPVNKANTAANTALTIGGGVAPLENPILLGEKINQADWTNTYRTVSPTGILLNNLPFILLIVVALGGFVGYIASKRRKATN